MQLTLPIGHPLAQAVLDMLPGAREQTWLVLKSSTQTHFRALVSKWHVDKVDAHPAVWVEFETQDEYVERMLRAQGL